MASTRQGTRGTRVVMSPGQVPPWLIAVVLLVGVVFVPTLRSRIPLLIQATDNFVIPAVAIFVAWSFPRPALAFAMVSPLFAPALSSLASGSRLESAAFGASVTAVVVFWRKATARSRQVVLTVVLPLCALSLFTGCIWPLDIANQDLIIRTVLLASLVAAAAALAPYSERDWARALAPAGAWLSWNAEHTAGIMGRDVAVLGLNVNGVGLLAALGLVAAALGVRFDKTWLIPAYLGMGYLGIVGIEAARSRGSYVIIVLALVGWLLQRQLAGGGVSAAVGLLLYGALGVWASLQTFDAAGTITQRIGMGADTRVGGRSDAFAYHLGVGLNHPLTGIGLGNSEAYAARDPFATNRGLNSHDMISGLLSQTGIFPLLLYFTLLLLAFRRATQRSRWYLALVTPAIASTVLMMWWAQTTLSAILFGLLAAAAAQAAGPRPSTDDPQLTAHSSPAPLSRQSSRSLDGRRGRPGAAAVAPATSR